MNKYSVILFFLVVFLTSCFKEKPIAKPNYTGTPITANMGVDYTQQLYFDVQTRQFVDSNSRFDFDLAFDCASGKYFVWLNGANLMQCVRTGKTDLSTVTLSDTASKRWYVEFGSGLEDSNAIGKWFLPGTTTSNNEVYILKLGIDMDGKVLGYRKIKLNDYNGTYSITFCNMDNSDLHTATVDKVANKNKVFLSFKNGGVIKDFEPSQSDWDLIFTSYSTYFYVEKLPYRVTGVLTNPHKARAYFVDSITDYSTITLASVSPDRWNIKQDNIGYEWKAYEYGTYSVNPKKTYIIQSDNRYFKMRFLDFYSASGTKGYPKFEIKELL